jgi:hypothetical protein
MNQHEAALILIGCATMCLRSRDSPNAGIKGAGMRRRSVHLLLKMTVHSVESAGMAVKFAGTGPRNARSAKEICTGEEQARVKGAIPAMVAPERLAFFVE